MTGLSLFPASTGPIILNDLSLAMVFSYIFYETDLLYSKKIKYTVVILGVFPFVLLSAAMCFRPVLYAPFFLFFYAFQNICKFCSATVMFRINYGVLD